MSDTTAAALYGALIGGGLAILGSVLAAFLTIKWTVFQNQRRVEVTSLLRARELCSEMLALRDQWHRHQAQVMAEQKMKLGKGAVLESVEGNYQKQLEVLRAMSSVSAQLTLKQNFDVAVLLWASNGTEDDKFYSDLRDQIGKLINPKVQARIEYLRKVV